MNIICLQNFKQKITRIWRNNKTLCWKQGKSLPRIQIYSITNRTIWSTKPKMVSKLLIWKKMNQLTNVIGHVCRALTRKSLRSGGMKSELPNNETLSQKQAKSLPTELISRITNHKDKFTKSSIVCAMQNNCKSHNGYK